MSKNEKMIAIGIGAYLLYEWWKNQASVVPGASSMTTTTQGSIPAWVQQLSVDVVGGGAANPFAGTQCILG